MGKGLGYWTGYPFHVFLILANEFCERFSFYGMKAVLILFLWKGLGMTDTASTAIYHSFVVFCYLTPLIGAMIADGWLGKYRTILYVSMIYAVGNILMTVSAVKINDSYTNWLSFVALLVIAFGTGGIKPCVSSFGGDQFKDGQTRQKDSFFSLFYLTINIGSMISTILIPYIRGNIYCFSDNCYSLCFGIPAILMIASIVLFAGGTQWYTRNPPGESILKRVFGCMKTALSKKCCCGSGSTDGQEKDHWLDHAAPQYDQAFIEDVKDVLRVAWLFIPLPIFWSLYDQQGSKWTFQAQQMNGEFPGITIFPDMISFLNPLLVVIIVPFLEYLVYPCLDVVRIPNRPLQRMTLGMLLAAIAFLATGFLQIAIDKDQPISLKEGGTKLQVINACPYQIEVSYKYTDDPNRYKDTFGVVPPLSKNGDYSYADAGAYEFTVNFTERNVTMTTNFTLESQKAYQIFATSDLEISMHAQNKSHLTLTTKGESAARVFNGLAYASKVKLKTTHGEEKDPKDFGLVSPNGVSNSTTLIYAEFSPSYTDSMGRDVDLPGMIKSKNGPVYILLLAQHSSGAVVLEQIEELHAWTLNIFLQTPQYIIMTFGECLFSVTGLAFAYTQAPPSMKSILTAIWLLTVCFGNIIIIIIQSAASSMSSVAEFFLFSGIMFLTCIVFAVMSLFYTYVTPRVLDDDDTKVASERGSISKDFDYEYDKAYDTMQLDVKSKDDSLQKTRL